MSKRKKNKQNIWQVILEIAITKDDWTDTPAVPSNIPSISMIFAKQVNPRVNPIIKPTRSSFHNTRGVSLNSISSRAMPRIIVAEA